MLVMHYWDLKRLIEGTVSIKHGLRTGYKIRTRYKTRDWKIWAGYKTWTRYKTQTQTAGCGLGIR